MTSETMSGGWMASILRDGTNDPNSEDGPDTACTTRKQAQIAAEALGVEIECAEDASVGLWIVAVAPDRAWQIEQDGYAEWESGPYRIIIETP